MSALEMLNMGLQTLLPGVIGWLLVAVVLKDARHRAWAALLTLSAMIVLPWMPPWNESEVDVGKAGLSSWVPEWKVTIVESVPLLPTSTEAVQAAEAALWSPPHWSSMLVWVWASVSGSLALLHVWRTMATALWKRGLKLHERDGMNLRVAAALRSPCLAGVLRPEIVMPEEALREWSTQQWRWTLVHEREHLRGGDALVSWCLGWVKAALWWNPLVHRLIGEWEQAREEICDNAAAAGAEEVAPYSEFLLSVVAARSPGVAMAVSRPARRLKARLLSLLEHRPVRRWPHWSFLVLAAGVAVLWVNLVGCVSLEQTAAPVDEGPLMTRVFKVPPDFLTVFEEGKAEGSGLRPRVSALQGLKSFGVDFPDGASAVFNATTSQLIVKNTVRRLEQVEELIVALKARHDFQNVQIYITSKWVEMPSETPVVADLSVMTDPQFQVLIRSLSQRKGMDLMSSPSVTTRNGQRAIIEVVREMKISTAEMDFSGVRNELVPMIHEGKIRLGLLADIGTAFHAGRRMWARNEAGLEGHITIKHLIRRETEAVKDGETLVVHMGEPVKGRKVLLFLTPKLISPSGERLGMKEAMALQVKGATIPSVKPVTAIKASTAANPKSRIHLNAALFDLEGDFLKAMTPAPNSSNAGNAAPETASVPPGIVAVSGVMTPEQFKAAATEWRNKAKNGVREAVGVDVGAKAGTHLKFDDGSEVNVATALGADGSTIDLNITPRLKLGGQTRQVTTSITLWDGQTVLLGGVIEADEKGQPKRSQVLAITAQIVK